MLNELLVAWVSVQNGRATGRASPTLSIVRFANVATPFTAFTGPLPDSVAPPALPRAREIAPVKLGAVFPGASRAVTVTAGVIATPTWALLGCTPNARCVAGGGGPAVMLNELLVAWVSVPEVAVSVRPEARRVGGGCGCGATAFTAFTGAVPVDGAPPRLLGDAVEADAVHVG